MKGEEIYHGLMKILDVFGLNFFTPLCIGFLAFGVSFC